MTTKILHTKDTFPQSVEIIVPLIIEMLNPQSVVDFGCGVGSWLAAFSRREVSDILGIDGEYITENDLLIPMQAYLPYDLERVAELNLSTRFDLALCLECAEHLDAAAAPKLIKTLCRVATHVVFSAAIPGQPGMGHKNEQYPEYWQALFGMEDFLMFDFFRPLIWKDTRVEYWYRQNMYLFSKTPHSFRKPTYRWDGNVYVTRELFELYVKTFDSVNNTVGGRLLTPERKFHDRVLGKFMRFFPRSLWN